MSTYRYEITGTAAKDQTWTTAGIVRAEDPGGITRAIDTAMRESFTLLTEGKAVFGRPGEGCRGPYALTRLLIETVKQ